MSARLPDVPPQLARDTDDLLRKLDHTLENLRAFTERLRAATASTNEEQPR